MNSQPTPTQPSDQPLREPGTRARSGNAMGRTRSALLGATAECVARYGIKKTTMVDVASRSGVAKATLYNHFRTKDDVLAALVEQSVADLVAACVTTAAAQGLEAALVLVAQELAGSPALRKAVEEPALVASLSLPGPGRGWTAAREGVAAVLTAGRAPAGPAQVEMVLRWTVSQILWPIEGEAVADGASALVRGLGITAAQPDESEAVPQPVERRPVLAGAGLGWPG